MDAASAWDAVSSLVTDVVRPCVSKPESLDFDVLKANDRFRTAAASVRPSSRMFLGQFLTDSLFVPFIQSYSESFLIVCSHNHLCSLLCFHFYCLTACRKHRSIEES